MPPARANKPKKQRAQATSWPPKATDLLFNHTKAWLVTFDGEMGTDDDVYGEIALSLNQESAAWGGDPESYTRDQCYSKVHNTQQKARKWYNKTAEDLTQPDSNASPESLNVGAVHHII